MKKGAVVFSTASQILCSLIALIVFKKAAQEVVFHYRFTIISVIWLIPPVVYSCLAGKYFIKIETDTRKRQTLPEVQEGNHITLWFVFGIPGAFIAYLIVDLLMFSLREDDILMAIGNAFFGTVIGMLGFLARKMILALNARIAERRSEKDNTR